MNRGIIRDAFTTTLALELGYREPVSLSRDWNRIRTARRISTPRGLFEDEFTCLLSMI